VRRTPGFLLSLCLLWTAACSTPKRPRDLPAMETIVDAHNARVGGLDRLWARTSVRVEGRDAEGSKFSEQGEGHLQVERPDRVAVTVGKLGEVYFALGANGTQYWLVDVSNNERRVMLLGEQDRATPAKVEALGLPVHPRDLPLLMGLMPLDAASVPDPVWDEQGRAVLTIPSRWGSVALRYDPRSLDLVGSTAFNAEGGVVAEAGLGLHGPVTDAQGVTVLGRVPQRLEIRVPGFEGFVRVQLGEPQVRIINATVFTPERLRRAYRVDEVVDLDAVDWESE
jgi:hypothetical protein